MEACSFWVELYFALAINLCMILLQNWRQSSTMDKFKKVFLAVLTALCIAGWFRFTHGWAIWLQVMGTVVIVIAFSSLSELFGK